MSLWLANLAGKGHKSSPRRTQQTPYPFFWRRSVSYYPEPLKVKKDEVRFRAHIWLEMVGLICRFA